MKKKSSSEKKSEFWQAKCKPYGPTILRIAIGLVFFLHGSQKLWGWFGGPGLGGVQGFFGAVGIPLAVVFATVVAIVEFFGGIALILGAATRISGALLAFIMLIAMLTVHRTQGFFLTAVEGNVTGLAYVFILFAATASLAFSGPGKWALRDKC